MNDKPNYLTPKMLVEKHPFFSLDALRKHIHNSDINGLDVAIRRIGTKILINEQKFLEWIEER